MYFITNGLGDVMISALTSSATDCVFEFGSGQGKCYKIGMCFFSTHLLEVRNKDTLTRNWDNVPAWCDISISGLLLQ